MPPSVDCVCLACNQAHINAPVIEAHCRAKYGDGDKTKKQFVSIVNSTSLKVQEMLGLSPGSDSESNTEDYRVFVLGAFLTTDLSVSPYKDVLPAENRDKVVQLDVPTREKLFDTFVRETKRLGATQELKRDLPQSIPDNILSNPQNYGATNEADADARGLDKLKRLKMKKILVLACTEYPLLLDTAAMEALEKEWNCKCVVPEDTLVEALLDYKVEVVVV